MRSSARKIVFMERYNISINSISLVTIATIAISFLWGLYFQAPSVVKAIFSVLMILSAVIFPYKLINKNDFDKTSNFLLKGLLILSVVAIVRSIFNDDPDMYSFGNKWMTLFGNEYCTLLLLPPLFTYLATNPLKIVFLKKINYYYMALGALCTILLKFPLAFLVIFLPVFFPYVKSNYRFLICIAFFQATTKAVWGDNPTRAIFLYLAFGIASYILVYVIKNHIITKIFCILTVLAPFVLFAPMLASNIHEPSFFENAQTYITGKTDDSQLGTDTRTFLYYEMALDLTKTNSWVFGKGAFAHYYSAWFDEGVNGRFGRIGSEVPFLNFLMHGGIVYAFFYFALIAYAVYKGLWKSNNRFVQSIAVVAAGWFFNSFVCDLTGARYYHMVFFMLLGCCLSSRFLSMTDNEVALIFRDDIAV